MWLLGGHASASLNIRPSPLITTFCGSGRRNTNKWGHHKPTSIPRIIQTPSVTSSEAPSSTSYDTSRITQAEGGPDGGGSMLAALSGAGPAAEATLRMLDWEQVSHPRAVHAVKPPNSVWSFSSPFPNPSSSPSSTIPGLLACCRIRKHALRPPGLPFADPRLWIGWGGGTAGGDTCHDHPRV